jgi:hypothetical protein
VKKKALVKSLWEDLPKPARFDDIMSLMRTQLDNQQAKQLSRRYEYANGRSTSVYGFLNDELIGHMRNKKLLGTLAGTRNIMTSELKKTI